MSIKVLKEDSLLHKKIIDAENYLDKLGLRITYYNASDGIMIEDTKTSNIYCPLVDGGAVEYDFPRSCDCRWKLRE